MTEQIKECFFCKTQNTVSEGVLNCKKCGRELFNYFDNPNCQKYSKTIPDDSLMCPYCGTYSHFSNKSYFRNLKCVVCSHEETTNLDAEFCAKCGSLLQNKCTNSNCVMNNGFEAELGPHDKYCSECGEETLFFKKGYFTKDK